MPTLRYRLAARDHPLGFPPPPSPPYIQGTPKTLKFRTLLTSRSTKDALRSAQELRSDPHPLLFVLVLFVAFDPFLLEPASLLGSG